MNNTLNWIVFYILFMYYHHTRLKYFDAIVALNPGIENILPYYTNAFNGNFFEINGIITLRSI